MHLKKVDSGIKNMGFCGERVDIKELTTDIEKVTCDSCRKMLNFGPFVGKKLHGLYKIEKDIHHLIKKLEYFFGEQKEEDSNKE